MPVAQISLTIELTSSYQKRVKQFLWHKNILMTVVWFRVFTASRISVQAFKAKGFTYRISVYLYVNVISASTRYKLHCWGV